MSAIVITIVVLGIVVMLLLGIIAFLVTMLRLANEEAEMWRTKIDPPNVDWGKWDYIKGCGWKEDVESGATEMDDARI